MHVFVTGGTGQTGPAIVSELIGSGHTVTGLARSDDAAARLQALGATPLRGSVDDLDTLHTGAAQADGVVHMAIAGDFSDPEDITRREVAAIQALGQALVDTDKPLVTTSGTLVLPAGQLTTEHDTPDPNSIGSLRSRALKRVWTSLIAVCAPSSCGWLRLFTARVTMGSSRC
ncbi:NAD(P)H-binding protein [Jatrophihabitans sp. DSM 44399]|uniref:NAD(P)H-binding protein n=1 Tax=Jatrophihabitans lederbergiae TaxID=3075547 RepID=A0ABU2JFX5_9ACTN|nr:NAD-dependent epimerase/dehydratase family protein [Jatrophihabitans sp. DSM 44399]MDT0263890.1 NAD(P)H-binding protein [Jatrophihabitans sp. DSM 44399]